MSMIIRWMKTVVLLSLINTEWKACTCRQCLGGEVVWPRPAALSRPGSYSHVVDTVCYQSSGRRTDSSFTTQRQRRVRSTVDHLDVIRPVLPSPATYARWPGISLNSRQNTQPMYFYNLTSVSSVLWHYWLGFMWPVKLSHRYWRGYLSEARCKWFVYCPADATATPSSLTSLKSRLI